VSTGGSQSLQAPKGVIPVASIAVILPSRLLRRAPGRSRPAVRHARNRAGAGSCHSGAPAALGARATLPRTRLTTGELPLLISVRLA
jgi:hypothetical protein